MSGAYEHNWQKHKGLRGEDSTDLADAFARWQNKLPLFNTRLSNLSAAIIRPQLAEIPRRVRDGRANHHYVAGLLNETPWLQVPDPLPPETRAPDSIQVNLAGFDSDDGARAYQDAAKARG